MKILHINFSKEGGAAIGVKRFHEALKDCGIRKVLPDSKSITDGVSMYENFPHGEGGTFKDAAEDFVIFSASI